MNQFIQSLANVCERHVLNEKWLIAPNRRVGYQWIDSVCRTGQAAVNVRIFTLKSLALELSGDFLAHHNVALISNADGAFIMEAIWNRLRDNLRYFSSLQPRQMFFNGLFNTIQSIRLAGLSVDSFKHEQFDTPEKGKDVLKLLSAYKEERLKRCVVDYADVLEWAIQTAKKATYKFPDALLVLLPESTSLSVLEQNLLDTFPEGKLNKLPVDPPRPCPASKTMIFQALGESNEVREVLRRCLRAGYALDEVELIHTNSQTYLPLIYELSQRVNTSIDASTHGLPVTFAEGISTRYSRPGRAVKAWVEWMRNDYMQKILVLMIEEGLLELPESMKGEWDHFRLAEILKSIGIGFGRYRYLRILNDQLQAINERMNEKITLQDEDDEFDSQRYIDYLRRRVNGILALIQMIERLFETQPDEENSPFEQLKSARRFIEECVKYESELDHYSRIRLLDEIKRMQRWFEDDENEFNLDIWAWLADLPNQLFVMGSAPRPGHMHVSNIQTGGHTGREHTFIIGMDDSRFPGSALQDPILLDQERSAVSPHLTRSYQRLEEKRDEFYLMLGRLRGDVSFGFSGYDIIEDRECFPSPMLLDVFRSLTEQPAADQQDFMNWLESPASYTSKDEDGVYSLDEWWLWRFCGSETVAQSDELVFNRFPHLRRGWEATQQRYSNALTPYDGIVPDAGQCIDAAQPGAKILSATALETAGSCPLKFFFRYILGIKVPDELIVDPERWLDPLAYGSLLHDVFHQFMQNIITSGETPSYKCHKRRLDNLLEEKIENYLHLYPPVSENAYRVQYNELKQAAHIFLTDEEVYGQHSRAVYLEQLIQDQYKGEASIQIQGRLDRIDRIEGKTNSYTLIDYKTGGTSKYETKDPFDHGRVMQHALYVKLADAWLKKNISPNAKLEKFIFYFPSVKGKGRRIEMNADTLLSEEKPLVNITSLMASGCFMPTTNSRDCQYCDYQAICGDVSAITKASQMKLENPENFLSHPFAELRENDR